METYELFLSYNPDKDDLASSLSFLSKIVGNQSKADQIMASGLDAEGVISRIALQDIKYDSIRLFIKNIILNTKEEHIQDKGILAFWNQFLIEVKEPFLKYACEHETLEDFSDVGKLRDASSAIAQKNKVPSMPIEGLSDELIVEYLSTYSVPSEVLGNQQTYKAICNGKSYELNRKFKVTPEQKADILDGYDTTYADQTLFLKPRKPCYEGESMWDFHTQSGRPIKGKIEDLDWLCRFQNNTLSASEFPFPGTIMKVLADITIQYDKVNFKKGEQALIKKVYGIVHPADVPQIKFEGI